MLIIIAAAHLLYKQCSSSAAAETRNTHKKLSSWQESQPLLCLLSVFAKMLDDYFPASVLGILGAMAKMTLVGALLHKLGR
jgi:hypothetical protein